jgi:hypothetical protein
MTGDTSYLLIVDKSQQGIVTGNNFQQKFSAQPVAKESREMSWNVCIQQIC